MLAHYSLFNLSIFIYRSVVSYKTTPLSLYTDDNINNAPNLGEYDSLDEGVIQEYNEFILASRIFYTLKEAACSEQSARMTAMDAASKNAGRCHTSADKQSVNLKLETCLTHAVG